MYASIEELRRRLGDVYAELYLGIDGAPLDREAEEDITAAAAEIDGRIARRYRLPVTSPAVLPLLKSWTLTLAEELAWSRSGHGDAPENLKTRVANVRKLLDDVAAGTMSLPGAEEAESSTAKALIVEAEEPVFTRKKLRRF